MRKTFFTVLLMLGCLTLVIPLCMFVVSVFLVSSAPAFDDKKRYNAILVLGNPTREDGSPSSILGSRINKAVELHKAGSADFIVMSGGPASNFHVEAEVMKAEAVRQGIEATRIIVEPRSRFTVENAKYCKAIVEKKNWKDVIVLTSTYHAQRSHFIFGKFGFNYCVLPVELPGDVSAWQRAVLVMWDKFLLLKYYLLGDENFPKINQYNGEPR